MTVSPILSDSPLAIGVSSNKQFPRQHFGCHHLQCPWNGASVVRNNKAPPPASLSPSLPSSGPVTGIIRLMVESRTSHRLTTRRISRSCVFLTTPRARGFAATYNQHIFMSRSQTPLLNGASFASLVPAPRFVHLVSSLSLSPPFSSLRQLRHLCPILSLRQ